MPSPTPIRSISITGSASSPDGTGIMLNNELDDFAAKPGVPNAFGLLGGAANAPGPDKRPLSSMTPTIVLKDGKPVLVTGSPRRQPDHYDRAAGDRQRARRPQADRRCRGGAAAASPVVAGRGLGGAELSRRQDPGADGTRSRGARRGRCSARRIPSKSRRRASPAPPTCGRGAPQRRDIEQALRNEDRGGSVIQDTTRRCSNMRARRRRASLLRVRRTPILIDMPRS